MNNDNANLSPQTSMVNHQVEDAHSQTNLMVDNDAFLGYNQNLLFVHLFPLFEDIIKKHHWKLSFYFIQHLFLVLQMIILSFYPHFLNRWNSESAESLCEFIHGFACIYTFSSPHSTADFNFINCLIVGIIFLLIIILSIVSFLLYIYNPSSHGIAISIAIFIFQFSIYIFYFPVSYTFSTIFSIWLDNYALGTIAFLIFAIMFIIATAYMFLSNSVLNFLSNPNRSFLAVYDGNHLSLAILIFSLNLILGNINQLLPDWLNYLLPILKILSTLYLIYDVFSFPFVHFYSNIAAISFYIMSVTSDILIFFDNISPYLRFFFPICIFAISFLAFSFVFRWMKNSILKILNDRLVSSSEEYMRKNINPKSIQSAYLYLRIGFFYESNNILTGNVSFYLAEKMNDIDYWICVTSIMSFFPAEKENFSHCLKKFEVLYPKTFLQKLRVFHLIKLEQHRYLTSSNEISQRLAELNAQTGEAIALTKKFWLDVSNEEKKLSLNTLNTIAKSIIDTNNSWKQTLSMFPLEYRFTLDYSNFLVECKGLFEKGMLYLIKANHLEKGHTDGVDELFRAFACSVPSFLHDKIVDKRGNITNQKSQGFTTIRARDNANEKLEEDIENGMIEQLMKERYEWPILRSYLSRATSKYRIPYLGSFVLFKYIFFVVVFALILLMDIFFATTYNYFEDVYNLVDSFNNMHISIAYLYGSFLLQWGSLTQCLDFTNDAFNYSIDKGTQVINLNDLRSSILYWFTEAQNNYIFFFKNLLNLASRGQCISQLAENIIEKNIKISTCTYQDDGTCRIETYEGEFKSAVTLILYTVNSLIYGNESVNINHPRFCKIILLFPELQNVFNSISYDYANLAIEMNNKVHYTFYIVFYVFLGFSILIWMPFIIIPQFILQKESQRILSALKSVSKDAAFAASKRMSLKDDRQYNIESHITQQYMYGNSWFLLSYRSAYALIVLVILIFTITSFVFASKISDRYAEYILIDHYGSIRHGETSELLDIVVLQSISSQLGFPYFNSSYLKELFSVSSNHLFEDSNKFIHGDNRNGISKFSSTITNLQVKDKCEILSSSSSYYHCLSFQRAISLYVILGQNAMNDQLDETFRLDQLGDFLHLGTCEIDAMNTESRSLMLDLMNSNVSQSKGLTISLLTISIFLLIGLTVFDVLINAKMNNILKTALLLIRHIPPPDIIESAELRDILLDQKSKGYHKRNDVYEVVFNTISSPILLVSYNAVIEMANSTFESIFQIKSEQIVGSRLTSFIPRQYDHFDLSIEEQGTFNLYEKLRQIQNNEIQDETFTVFTRCVSSYNTNTDKNEGQHSLIPVNLSVYTVRSQDQVTGFIFIIEDKERDSKIKQQLEESNNNVNLLMSKLIPESIASYIELRQKDQTSNLSFTVPESILIAVHIKNIEQYLKQNWDDFNELISGLETDSIANSPFALIHTAYDIVLFIGGIFGDIDMSELSSQSLHFVESLINTLDSREEPKIQYSISIVTGGPLLAEFFKSSFQASASKYKWAFNSSNINKYESLSWIHSAEPRNLVMEGPKLPSFDVFGDLLTEAVRIAQMSSPETIILNAKTYELCKENFEIICSDGPVYKNNPTYVISSDLNAFPEEIQTARPGS